MYLLGLSRPKSVHGYHQLTRIIIGVDGRDGGEGGLGVEKEYSQLCHATETRMFFFRNVSLSNVQSCM